ncbi:MinD-like ATPase involved in chromosome partitioning or flagellar assembly [Natronoarchaeum philippinense]|uniref:MinD-like ATPase involved in chromosome partitioning or flagellar assembly n=1 Tax=Natronoarchaeum philippinense TaxID=558529 RepID=A0A285NUF7_NATPI|nr:P-loop NTPase [Natronoarchaeum philippinense]SNZ12553.1 MinD-like ATPase involved in chromosome partitioning or flagellar assembly [Natronoarchaeum philippinense]
MTGTVYAILGGKDDVGATATAVALGTSLAEQARRVAVIDADFAGDGVGATLGLGDADATLGDVVGGDADLDDALVETAHGLQVLPGDDAVPHPTDVRSHALVRAADRVRERFDIVLVDLGTTAGTAAAFALERVDGVVLTTTPANDAIAAVADAATVARYHGADVLGTAFTKVPDGTEIDHRAAADALDSDVLALVPEDGAVRESADAGTSLLRHDPDSPAAMVYWQLAERLAAGDFDGEPVAYEQPGASDATDPGVADETGANGSDSTARQDAAAESASESAEQTVGSGTDESPDSEPSETPVDEESPATAAAADEDAGEEPVAAVAPDGVAEEEPTTGDDDGDETPDDADGDDAGDDTAPDGIDSDGTADDATAATAEADNTTANEFSWDDGSASSSDDGDGSPAESNLQGSEEGAEAADSEHVDDGRRPDGTDQENEHTGDNDPTQAEDAAEEQTDDDEMEAAFKATMDKVREQREEESDDKEDTDDEDDSGGMFGIGG